MSDVSDEEFARYLESAPSAPAVDAPAAPGVPPATGEVSDEDFAKYLETAPAPPTLADEALAAGKSVLDGAGALAQGVGQGVAGLVPFLPAKAALRGLSAAAVTGVNALAGGETDFDRNYAAVESASKDVEEASPTAALVGQIGGSIAGSVLAGGGAVQLLAKAAPATAARVAALGTLGRMTAATAGVLGEGAASGVGMVLDEAIETGNYEGIASRMAEGAGQGAMWAAVFGGAAIAATKGLSAIAKAADKVGEWGGAVSLRAAGAAADDLDRNAALLNYAENDLQLAQRKQASLAAQDAVPLTTADEIAAAADARAADLATPIEKPPVFTRDEQLVAHMEYDDVVNTELGKARDAMDELYSIDDYFGEHGGRAQKQRLFARLAEEEQTLGKVGTGVVDDFGDEVTADLAGPRRAASNPLRDDYLRGLIADVRKEAADTLSGDGAIIYSRGGAAGQLKYIDQVGGAYEGRLAGKMNAGKIGEAFNDLDNMRLTLGKLAQHPDRRIAEFGQRHYEKFRVAQEDPRLVGELGDLQRVFNAGYSKEISAKQGMGLSGLAADAGEKSAATPWKNERMVNDRALLGMLRESGGPLVQQQRAYMNYLAAMETSLTARAKVLQDPALLEKANRARDLIETIRNSFDESARSRQAKEAFLRTNPAAQKVIAEIADSVPVVRNVAEIANKLGSILGADEAARAERIIADRAAARAARKTAEERAAQAVVEAQRRLESARTEVVRQAKQISARRVMVESGKALGAGMEAVGTAGKATGKVAESLDSMRPEAVSALTKSALRIVERSREENDLHGAAAAVVAGGAIGPGGREAFAKQAETARALIRELAGDRPNGPMGAVAPMLPPERARAILDAQAAIDAPSKAIQEMARGGLSPAGLKALERVHGGLLQRFRQDVMSELGKSGVDQDTAALVATRLGVAYTDPMRSSGWVAPQSGGGQAQPAKPSGRKYKARGNATLADRMGESE